MSALKKQEMESESSIQKSSSSNVSFYFSFRFLIGVVGFLGYMLQYMQKIDMGIGIVCMVNHTAIAGLFKKTDVQYSYNASQELMYVNTTFNVSADVCAFHEQTSKQIDGPFVWEKKTQGFILSAYFYGYIMTQILAGVLASKFGSKIMLFIGMFGGSLMTLLAPLLAKWSFIALVVCRFLTGICQSFFMPGMSSLWVYWAPPAERSRLIGMSHAGGMIGNIVALLFGGFLCAYGFDGGWGSIFYIFGLMGMIWVVICIVLFSNTPNNHRFISEREKAYILEKTKKSTFKATLRIPWIAIFKSQSCWAIFVAHFCNNWGIYLLLTQLPSYMKEVLKFNIKSNGLMSSVPFFSCWICIMISSLIADRIIQSGRLSISVVRKIFNGIGLLLPVVTIFGLSFVTCESPYIAVTLLSIGMAFMGFSLGAGYYVNINDVAGQYSGVVFGISNTFGSIPGLICPYITSILTIHQTQKEWQIVFIICAVVYLFGFVFYTVFSGGEIEPWAQSAISEAEEEIEEKKSSIEHF